MGFPPVIRGKSCPRCGARTGRARRSVLIRVVRLLFRDASLRRCPCGWRGVSV